METPFAVVYRSQKHPILNILHERGRQRYQSRIRHNDLRGIVKALRANQVVWYTPDLDAGPTHGEFVPFLGVRASTSTVPARLARLTHCEVIPGFPYRRQDGTGYDLYIYPALERFPGEDLRADALRVNHVIGQAIRHRPEQYLWALKRFKTRPAGEGKLYKRP